jgi:lipoprotein-anchoring transpeptidase ErfK/SrfK
MRTANGSIRLCFLLAAALWLTGFCVQPAQAAPPGFEPERPCATSGVWRDPRCARLVEGVEAPTASPPASPPAPIVPTNQSIVCTPGRVWRQRESCPAQGPATTAYRIAHIRLPDPLPELPLVELTPPPDEEVVPFTFGYVRTLPLEIYRHPLEASMGLPPVRILYSGDQWVSIDGEVEYEGTRWYQINEGEFARADAIILARPSRFQGVYLNEQPAYPFAWINRPTRPSLTPQGAENPNAPTYQRYEIVTIFAQEYLGGEEMWYLIAPDQWVPQSNVSKVTVDPPPAGVGAGERWIEVDLFEQTLAAYEGERMVYATLISSGRPGSTWTDSGLFRIWYKLRAGKMSNPDAQDGSPAWYYLEDVPWTMYFNGATALHSAYWHDSFGFTRSHGCVNLAPRDAEWLFNWTSPYLPEGVKAMAANGNGTWVWVHNTPPW